jgi:O-antigen ligase
MSSGQATPYALSRQRPLARPRVPVAYFLRQYGPFAIATYMLACGRWGSYLLPGPPYIGDLVLTCVVGERIIAAGRRRQALNLGTVELTLGVTCGLLVAWSCIRFLYGSVSVNSIRDVAPYAYAILVFLTPRERPTQEQRRKMENVMYAALLFHAAWVTLAITAKGFVASLPTLGGGQAQFFQVRQDVDSTICGVMLVYCLYRAISGRRPWLNLAIAAWQVGIIFGDYSRSALAGCAMQLLVFLLLTPAARQVIRRYGARMVVPLLLILLPVGIYVGTQSGPVKRLSQAGNSFIPIVPTKGDPTGGATGTARARRLAWQAIEIYIEQNNTRDWTGVGFGPDFLHDSGGDILLLGGSTEDVRQPHDYVINTWARLGLIGLIMIIAIAAFAIRNIGKLGRSPQLDGMDIIAIAVAVGLSVSACYGVVLESPFGALPVWWALGYIGYRAVGLRLSWPLTRG